MKSWEAREGHIPWGAWKFVRKRRKGGETGGMTENEAIKNDAKISREKSKGEELVGQVGAEQEAECSR